MKHIYVLLLLPLSSVHILNTHGRLSYQTRHSTTVELFIYIDYQCYHACARLFERNLTADCIFVKLLSFGVHIISHSAFNQALVLYEV